MTSTGRIVEVSAVPLGDVVTADHAAGVTTLTLNSVVDFDEGGGTLSYVSPADDVTVVVQAYTKADPDADTITLAAGLTVALPADSFVGPHPPSDEKVALVLLDDQDDPLAARVPHSLYALLPEGVRDPEAQEAVEVDIDTGGEWYITDVFEVPNYDGSFIDPSTVPPSPPTPPAAPVTPTFTVTGMPRGLMVQVSNGLPGWTYTYTITDHTTDTTADVTASYPDTKRSQLYVEWMPSGTPLSAASDGYSFHITATNESGSATSGESTTQPLVLNDSNTIAELAVGKLISGDLNAAIALLGAISVGAAIEINPDDGIVVHTPLGDMVLPADGSNPKFTGEATFAALTALGNLKIQGTTNELAKGATLELATSTTAPKAGPSLSSLWPTKSSHPGYSSRGLQRLGSVPGGARYLCTESLFGASIDFMTENSGSFDLDIGGVCSLNTNTDPGRGAWNRSEITGAMGGIAVIGNNVFVLCGTDAAYAGTFEARWYIYKGTFDTGTGKIDYVTRWEYEPASFLGGHSAYIPSLGVKESTSELVVAQCGSGGLAWLTTYSQTGTQISQVAINNADGTQWNAAQDFCGCGISAADFGTDHFYLLASGGTVVRVMPTSTMNYDSVKSFPQPSPGNTRGVMWDASKSIFRTMYRSANAGGAASISDHTGITATKFSVVQTWRKSNSTSPAFATYETDKSPATNVTGFPKRAALSITSGPIPDDITDPNDPDALTFYVATNDLSGTLTSYKRQAPTATGSAPAAVTSQVLTSVSTGGGNPPSSNNFPAGVPGRLISKGADSSPLVDIRGTGQWRLGDISGDSAGRVVGGAFVPIGGIIEFYGTTPDVGWLLLNGSTFLESTYPILAARLIAAGCTTTGTAPNRTVTLPDHRGRVPIGAGTARALGANEGAAESARGLTHVHGMNHNHADTFGLNKTTDPKPSGSGGGSVLLQGTSLAGSVTSFSGNTSPGTSSGADAISHLGVNFIIRAA